MDAESDFRPLRGLRVSQSVLISTHTVIICDFRPLRGLRVSQ